jgi:DNA polymerase III gamma/tau subunit
VAAIHPEARHLAAVADAEWDELTRLARRTPAVHLHNLLSVLLQGEEELKRAPQPRLALEVLLLRVIHLEPVLPLVDWLARLDALERRLEAGPWVASEAIPAGELQPPAAALQAGEPAASRPGSPAAAGLQEQWQAFLTFVQEKENGPLSGKLAHSRLVDRADHRLKVVMGRPWNAAGPQHEVRLQELARAFFGADSVLEFATEAPPAQPKSAAAARKPLDMGKLQQQALEIFGGEWVGPAPGKEEPQ